MVFLHQYPITKVSYGSNYLIDKSFNDISRVYVYSLSVKGDKEKELYFKFNEQDLVSNVLLINTQHAKTSKEQKSIIYKKAEYNEVGKIVELKEYKTKNYKQFDDLISKKGEDFFLNMLFEDMTKDIDFILFETTTYTYKKDRLSCSEAILHYSKEELIEQKYKYDEQDRMIEMKLYQDNELYSKETYSYD